MPVRSATCSEIRGSTLRRVSRLELAPHGGRALGLPIFEVCQFPFDHLEPKPVHSLPCLRVNAGYEPAGDRFKSAVNPQIFIFHAARVPPRSLTCHTRVQRLLSRK